jgi:transcriptional regulator GlxA family with amidase domain
MIYVPDRRYVVDRAVVTTTGVSASIPVSLALVEAIGGRELAQKMAREIGTDDWSASHDSAPFQIDRRAAATYLESSLGFWRAKRFDLPIDEGVDEIALALVADAWSRTERANVAAISAKPVRSRDGLEILPDKPAGG